MSTIDQTIIQDQLIGTEAEREEGYNRLFGEEKPEIPTTAYPWWQPQGARVLAIRPYTGFFKDFYTHWADIEAPNVRSGFLTVAIDGLDSPDWFHPRSEA